MVVSGVPKENGILHAGEIASMALDLVNVCKTFKIPHKPNTLLEIRAGIHSGMLRELQKNSFLVYQRSPWTCFLSNENNVQHGMEHFTEVISTVYITGFTGYINVAPVLSFSVLSKQCCFWVFNLAFIFRLSSA